MIPLRDSVPLRTWPVVTWLLIGMNVWAFLNELLLGPELEAFVRTWGFVPARYFALGELHPEDWAGRYLPILTSMFLHGGWLHLAGNMWFLWIFGDNVEDMLGSIRFVFFYLFCGLAAGFTHFILDPSSSVPTIGASGAIAGVLGGYMLLFPGARVLTLVPLGFFLRVMEIPAAVMIGLWFVIQLASGVLTQGMEQGGVAWWAHVGGFVAGLVLVFPLRRRRKIVV